MAGRVSFPNGTLGVAGAQVFVASGGAADSPRTGSCGQCIDRDAVRAYAETGADGRFELTGVPAGSQEVVIRKGPFERRVPVEVAACAREDLSEAEARLPRSSNEGRVPRIAVISGAFDRMEDVLHRLGLDPSVYDVFEGFDPQEIEWGIDRGATDEARRFLRDRSRLDSYDIIFINCGTTLAEGRYDTWGNRVEDAAAGDPRIVEALRAFVEQGGRLYVTDLAYDFVERLLPGRVDFLGGGGDGLAQHPEHYDAAQAGDELPNVRAHVEDDALAEWLASNQALEGDGTFEVRGFEPAWAVIDRVDAERTSVWASGQVSWGNHPLVETDSPPGRGSQPLTISFDAGCGRALFTSFHTVPHEQGFSTDDPWSEGSAGEDAGRDGELTTQEKVLAYLVLEVGTCVAEPELI